MAVRRTILCFGDDTVAGRPASELTPINASYTDAQADCQIWNIQSQAWQALTPGTNTNTRAVASTLWSFESRLREGLRSYYPSATLYVIKDASTTSVADWRPQAGAAYAALLTQVLAAANAAAVAGDTLSIEAIATSVQILDHVRKDWACYGDSMFSIIESLRVDLGAISGVSMGSLRNDGGLTPVVVLEPHYAYIAQDGRLQHIRMQAQTLENEGARVRVLRSHRYTANADGTYAAQSQVDMAADVAQHLFLRSTSDGSNPESTIVALFGDSTVEGFGPFNSELPAHLQGAISGASIWRPTQGSFATLQAGVNNQISVPFNVFHGYEIALADRLRDDHNVWVVKGTQINSIAANFRGMTGVATPPSYNRHMISWAANHRGLSDLYIRGYLVSAIEALRDAGRKPVMGLVVIGLGTNDSLFADADVRGTLPAIEGIIAQVREICSDMGVDTSALRFVCTVPPTYSKDAPVPFDTIVDEDLDLVRAGILDLPNRYEDVNVVDMSSHSSTDLIHPNAAGNNSIAAAIYSVFKSTTGNSVQPMFSPSMEHLKKALRLSGVGQDNDALSMIDNAVQSAKARMFGFLGDAKMASLQQIPYTNAPASSSDYLRLVAAETEIKIVRSELIRSLPLSFKDGQSVIQTWNEEGAFRDGGFLQVEKELKRLNEEIATNLGMLSRAELGASAQDGTVSAFPLNDNDAPGASVFTVI